jgi:glycosyltransferase involved in cell wall biosynthesis
MTLAIDMVGTNLGSGTKTYNINFCEYLNKRNLNERIYIFITETYKEEINDKKNKNITYIIKSKFLANIFFRIIWMQFFLPFELIKLKVSRLYSPMNFSPVILKFFNIKLILALHSNLPWVFFKQMSGNLLRNYFTKFIMEISIFVCDKLIVDSKFAKDEIVNLLNINEKKVSVVYLGIEKKYLDYEENNNYIDNFDYKNYIISVMSCVKYHNIINLLKAFKSLKKKNTSNLKFIFVTQVLDDKYFLEIKKFINNNFNEDEIVFFHNLDNKYLVNLYKKADLFIFSSYCEVFGLTSLEAMAQACPVAISNRSALPEINNNAADYFDPDNIMDIRKSMENILYNSNYKKNLITKGNEHFKKFKWSNTVEETIKVLAIK